MKKTVLISVAGVVACLCAATASAQDAASLTCGQFAALDGPGKDQAAYSLMLWSKETANASAAGILPNLFAEMNRKGVHQLIDQRCTGEPAGTNVVDRLRQGA